MEPFDDNAIVERVAAGDTHRYKQIVRKYQDTVYTLMLRFTPSSSTAQDLVQETFMKAYANLYRFDTQRRFFPWLYTIAMNTARDWSRKNKGIRHLPFSEELDTPVESDPESGSQHAELEGKERAAMVQKNLMGLKEEYREALVLRYRYDMSVREIAEVLGLSVSAAKMRIHRGLKKMQLRISV